MACSVFLSRCFLSFCIPRGGVGTCGLCVCVCALLLCLRTPHCSCLLVIGFCDLTSLVYVCHLWFALLSCACVCVHMFACLRVALWLPLPGQYFYFQEVLPVLAAKHCIMQANAELHQSVLAKQKKRFGEEIARLQVCIHLEPISDYSLR